MKTELNSRVSEIRQNVPKARARIVFFSSYWSHFVCNGAVHQRECFFSSFFSGGESESNVQRRRHGVHATDPGRFQRSHLHVRLLRPVLLPRHRRHHQRPQNHWGSGIPRLRNRSSKSLFLFTKKKSFQLQKRRCRTKKSRLLTCETSLFPVE